MSSVKAKFEATNHWIRFQWAALVMLAVSASLTGCSMHRSSPGSSRGTSPRLELTFTKGRDTWTGTWQGFQAREFLERPQAVPSVLLNFISADGRSKSSYGFTESGSAFQARTELPLTPSRQAGPPQAVELALPRPAGELVVRGNCTGSDANGTFELRPAEEYAAGLARLCGRRPNRDETLRLLFSRATVDEFERIQTAGYRLSIEDCLRLAGFGVDAKYATAMRPAFQSLSIDSLLRLRQFGVTPEFALALRDAGATFDPNAVVRLRQFGVPVDMVRDLHEAGFELSADDIVRLRNFGVTAGFAAAVKRAQIGADPEQIIRLRQFGVPANYIEELKQAGGGFSADEIVRLRQFGVSSDFIAQGRKVGYAFSTEEWIQLRNFGVNADYLAALVVPGKQPLPAKAIIELRQRGVSADTARSLREQ